MNTFRVRPYTGLFAGRWRKECRSCASAGRCTLQKSAVFSRQVAPQGSAQRLARSRKICIITYLQKYLGQIPPSDESYPIFCPTSCKELRVCWEGRQRVMIVDATAATKLLQKHAKAFIFLHIFLSTNQIEIKTPTNGNMEDIHLRILIDQTKKKQKQLTWSCRPALLPYPESPAPNEPRPW